MEERLHRILRMPGLDRDELVAAMLSMFGSGWHGNNPDVIEYGSEHQKPAVRLQFEDSDLLSLEPGSHLTSADVDRLEDLAGQLAAPRPTHFGKVILFARLPVDGFHEVGDVLQIRPVPDSASKPDFLMASDFPFLLEYAYAGSEHSQIDARRRSQYARDLTLLLNVLVVPGVAPLPRMASFVWVRDPTLNDGDGGFAYRQKGYWYPDFQFGSDSLSDTAGLEHLQVIPHKEYFRYESFQIGNRFGLWDGFDAHIEGYLRLDPKKRHQFLRSAHWFFGTAPLMRDTASIAFLSLIMAIEGLLPPREGEHRCDTCGNVVGESGTKRFISFLEEHAPTDDPEEIAARKRLYRLRSRLAHGGDPFRMETETDLLLHPDTAREISSVSGGWSLTKAVLITWLSGEIARLAGVEHPSSGD